MVKTQRTENPTESVLIYSLPMLRQNSKRSNTRMEGSVGRQEMICFLFSTILFSALNPAHSDLSVPCPEDWCDQLSPITYLNDTLCKCKCTLRSHPNGSWLYNKSKFFNEWTIQHFALAFTRDLKQFLFKEKKEFNHIQICSLRQNIFKIVECQDIMHLPLQFVHNNKLYAHAFKCSCMKQSL